MAEVINIHQAKTTLSRLVQRVEAGEEVVIGRAGRPVAKLVPYRSERPTRRRLGRLRGKIVVHGDFDADNREIQRLFEEGALSPEEG